MNRSTQVSFFFRCFCLLWVFAPLASNCRSEEPSQESRDRTAFSTEEFKKHVIFLASDDLTGRAPGSDGSAKALKYILEQFQKSGLKPLLKKDSWIQEFPLDAPDQKTGTLFAKNAIAVYSGRGELKDEAVIVCAHYDHLGVRSRPGEEGEDRIYNGADDNASGVAAILLMAKALTEQSDSAEESHRTVIFVSFDAEEQGLLGAKHYVQRPPWPLEKTAAVINFDVVGRMRKNQFFACDIETNPMLAETVREAAREQAVVAETRLGGHGRSDHVIFQQIGIPGVHFFTGASIHYHQVTDHWETMNFKGGATIAWVGYQALRKAMTYPDPIEFQKLSPTFSIQRAIDLVQSLGIIPNVNAQQGNYPEILFVTPNSPAAKAGIESGDQITALNGLRFNRVEDGLLILQQLSFDEGLRMEVLREGETKELTIPANVFEQLKDQSSSSSQTRSSFSYSLARSPMTRVR